MVPLAKLAVESPVNMERSSQETGSLLNWNPIRGAQPKQAHVEDTLVWSFQRKNLGVT